MHINEYISPEGEITYLRFETEMLTGTVTVQPIVEDEEYVW